MVMPVLSLKNITAKRITGSRTHHQRYPAECCAAESIISIALCSLVFTVEHINRSFMFESYGTRTNGKLKMRTRLRRCNPHSVPPNSFFYMHGLLHLFSSLVYSSTFKQQLKLSQINIHVQNSLLQIAKRYKITLLDYVLVK